MQLLLWRHQHSLVLLDSRGLVGGLVDRVRAVLIDVGALQSVVNIGVLLSVVECVLLLVDVTEEEVEDNSNDTTSNGWSTKVPSQVRIGDNGCAGKTDSVCETSVEEVDSRDQTSHVDWSTRVGDTVGWNVDEDLRDTTETVWDSHPPDSDWSNTSSNGTVAGAEVAARRLLVSVVVQDRVTSTSNSRHEQTSRDTCDWTVVDTQFAEKWVESVVKDRDGDNDRKRVEVLDNVVWHTVGGQHGRQVASGSTETVVVDVLDWEEAEHSSGLESALDILDELIVPVGLDAQSGGGDVGRLSEVPETVASNLEESSATQADTKNLHGAAKITASRWVENETRLQEPKEEWQRKVEQKWKQERQPPADVLLSVSCSNTHESTNVDEEVEPEHDTLSGRLRILDNSFSLFVGNDDWHTGGHLVEKQRRHIWLEHG